MGLLRKSRSIALRVLAVFGITFLIAVALYKYTAGPVHRGKPVTLWISQLSALNDSESREAQDALIDMGERAVPYLAATLERNSEGGPDAWIRRLFARLPPNWRGPWGPRANLLIIKGRILAILQKMGPRGAAAAPQVAQGFYSGNMHIGSASAEALGAMENAAIPFVRSALASTNYLARTYALHSAFRLRKSGAPLIPDLLAVSQAGPELRPRVMMALGAIGPAARPTLEMMLHTNDVSVIAEAAQTLAYIQPSSTNAVPRLLELRKHTNTAVRLGAFSGLANAAPISREARAVLNEGLTDSSVEVQRLAAESLGMYPRSSQPHIDTIASLLESPDRRVQAAALGALINAGTNAMGVADRVKPLAAHPDPKIARAAAYFLTSVGMIPADP